jgi:catechol 2,3-dioxygenase-like lactoylglutathione lyase family enzyme
VRPSRLDHVALWVADRDWIAGFVTAFLGMHVIDSTESFTLVGSDARRGKLTLFDAPGPRARGALNHVALRVSDLGRAASALPDDLPRDVVDDGIEFDVAEGLRLALVEAPTETEYDLDHVALLTDEPERAAELWRPLGFAAAPPGLTGAPRVEVGGSFLELRSGAPGEPDQPLLNHLAVLVESADEWRAHAEDLGVEIADVVDAANTYAVFVWGPGRVKLEYVEHKPSFSLT